jgi:signal transduction histidine kinase
MAFPDTAHVQVLLLAVLGALSLALGWRLRRLRRRAARDVDAAAERLRLVLWGTGDELWDWDLARNRVHRENPMRHMLAGVTEIVDASAVIAHMHPDDVVPTTRAITSHLKGETDHVDTVYRAKDVDGEWRWLRARGRVTARGPDGRALRIVGTNEDITPFKRAESALAAANDDLEQRIYERTIDLEIARDAAQQSLADLRATREQLVEAEKLAALGGLVAGVAHEINTPLGVAVTAASHLEGEVARLSKLDAEGRMTRADFDAFLAAVRDGSGLVLRNLRRAEALVRGFKQVAADQASGERRTIALGLYLEEVLASLKPTFRRTPWSIDLDCEDGLVLDTWPGATYQVVVNLVMNAIVHGFAGREHGCVRIVARGIPEGVALEVSDDGFGMAEDVRRRVFEPFYTTRRGQGGTGLGLHIAWNLVTRTLGGRIAVESEPGTGTRFRIELPRIAPEATANGDAAGAGPAPGAGAPGTGD